MNVKTTLDRIRVVEDSVLEADDCERQHGPAEKTLRALARIVAAEDEGGDVVPEWPVERSQSTKPRPRSRVAGQRALDTTEQTVTIRDDDWLGA